MTGLSPDRLASVKATMDEYEPALKALAGIKTTSRACKTCRHFTRLGLTAGKFWTIPEELERGYCHRNAPIESDTWPGVGATNVCGEWASCDAPVTRMSPSDCPAEWEFREVD